MLFKDFTPIQVFWLVVGVMAAYHLVPVVIYTFLTLVGNVVSVTPQTPSF